jgi:hypothetical protein
MGQKRQKMAPEFEELIKNHNLIRRNIKLNIKYKKVDGKWNIESAYYYTTENEDVIKKELSKESYVLLLENVPPPSQEHVLSAKISCNMLLYNLVPIKT